MKKDIMNYEHKRDLLCDMLYFYEQNGFKYYSKDYINDKIKTLTDKVIKKQETFDDYKSMSESKSDDEVITWKGYKIVEVPIFNHCDEETLKEFL